MNDFFSRHSQAAAPGSDFFPESALVQSTQPNGPQSIYAPLRRPLRRLMRRSWRQPPLALWTLMGLLLLLGGCSVRKVGYALAPRFLVSRIVDTYDLDRSQKKALWSRIGALFYWHRHTELPMYVKLLDGTLERLQDQLTQQEAAWISGEVDQAVQRLAKAAAPVAGQTLTGLSKEQIDHSEGAMKKGSQERFERLELPEEKYVAFRLGKARKNLTTWLGTYTEAQLREFEGFIRKNRLEEQRRMHRTEKNRAELLAALRSGASTSDLERLFFNWVSKLQTTPDAESEQAERVNQQEFIDMLLRIEHSLSPQQRQHLLTEIRSVRNDFAELAAEK